MINTLLKYAGNKRSYMGRLSTEFNWHGIDTYVDPFCGALGAALNCGVTGHDVVLSDVNWEVVNLYTQVRDQPSKLEVVFNALPVDGDTYYEVRSWDRDPNWKARDPIELAARTLYLNKHCFNGLFRVNRHGQFNVPWNRSLRDVKLNITADHQHLTELLRSARLTCCGYEHVMSQCGSGTLVYCDPPYVDVKVNKRSFTGYMGCFDMTEQVKLRDAVIVAHARGVRAYVSNSDCDVTRQLYACASRIVDITGVRRTLSCTSSGRGRAREILACFE
jgi:DNA adenine methylase